MVEVRSGQATFRRPAGGQVLGAIASGVASIFFIGFAVAAALGLLGAEAQPRLLGSGLFGFFGVLLALATTAAARQAIDTRVATIGSAGAWLLGMGLRPWSDIAEVRLERIRTVAGSRAPGTRQIRRLGFVLRDPNIRPSLATNLVWRMVFLYFRLVKAIAPQLRLGGDKPAPFGASELDLPRDFDHFVELVAAHVTIVDAAEVRARDEIARWSRPDPIAANSASPSLASLDAALVAPHPGTAVVAPDAPLVSPEAAAAAAQPHAVFGIPAVKRTEALFAVLPLVVPLFIIVPVVLPMVLRGGSGALFSLIVLGILTVFFLVPSLARIGRVVRRAADRRADPSRLRVGPDGIWTRGGGLVAWDGVAAIRTARSGYVRQIGMPPMERWRLVVESGSDGQDLMSVASDELESPFDDVLSLIRVYHPVLETS